MKKAHILYRNFYSPDGKKISIGGIQTYLINLSSLLLEKGYTPIIYQYSNVEFTNDFNGVSVQGINVSKYNKDDKKKRILFLTVMKNFDYDCDILLFGCETLIIKSKAKKVIAIQHGISWDLPSKYNIPKILVLPYVVMKSIRAYKLIKRISLVKKLVLVDYNFLNWYRTQVPKLLTCMEVIPNSVESVNFSPHRNNNVIKIIYARRFRPQRGTRIFSNVVLKLLREFNNLEFTFAGSGEDYQYLLDKFKDEKRVIITSFDNNETLKIHREHDIAVIPTIGSEGTSFSLLEAMTAGCAVLASNVGGMTNIILDGYNGILTFPDEKSLYNNLKNLITDEQLRWDLSKGAIQTIHKSFNISKWNEKWSMIIDEI